MGLIRHNILSHHEILQFIRDLGVFTDKTYLELRDILIDNNSYVMSPGDKSMYIVLRRLTEDSAELHVYISKKSRGKRWAEFVEEVREVIRDTPIKHVLNATNDRRVRMLMGYLGSERVQEIKGYTVYKMEV